MDEYGFGCYDDVWLICFDFVCVCFGWIACFVGFGVGYCGNVFDLLIVVCWIFYWYCYYCWCFYVFFCFCVGFFGGRVELIMIIVFFILMGLSVSLFVLLILFKVLSVFLFG